jgi:hypothetical protein
MLWHQCLIDLDGPYLVGAFLFSPILKIGPIPTFNEVYAALLLTRTRPPIWMQYRNYGASQSKLAYLKYDEDDAPAFVTKELLKDLANSDVWMEFQDIKLGAWADKNLRQMAIDGDVKDFYDKYYDTLSGYIHANWSAVSQSTFAVCVNPLHRFHKVPVLPQFFFEDAVPDLVKIANLALDQINTLYPPFKSRLKIAQTPVVKI